jgi:Bacterial toxin 44
MAPIPPAEARLAAQYLRNQANSFTTLLEQRRAEVTGRPDDLTAEADRHLTQAEDLQRAYATASAKVRGLAHSWKGDHYTQFAREGKGRLDHLSAVVRGLRRERSHLLRCERMLRRSTSGFTALIGQLEAKARLYIGQTSVRPYRDLSQDLMRDFRAANQEGQKITEELAKVLDVRQDVFPAAGRLGYNPQSLEVLPVPVPQDPRREYSEAVNLLLRRIRTDATSPSLLAIRDSWTKLPEIWNGFFADAELDTKPEFRQHFGMSARGDLTIPVAPEIGTVDGIPASMPYDLLGNIHYGYLNRLAGVPPLVFDSGARFADALFYGRIDAADALAVRIGSELYDRYPDPTQLRPEHINEALRRNFERFFQTGGFTPR